MKNKDDHIAVESWYGYMKRGPIIVISIIIVVVIAPLIITYYHS